MKSFVTIQPKGKYDAKYATYQEFANTFPSSGATVDEIGICSDGVTPIHGISVGDTTNKPVIFINSNIHGSEWAAAHYVMEFIQRMIDGDLPNNSVMARLKSRYSFYVIPSLNPWGYETTTYENFNGVNLNRNWDAYWNMSSDTDKGTAPFSEIETQIGRDKMLEHKPICIIDCHTTGGLSGSGIDVGKRFLYYRWLLDDCLKTIQHNTDYVHAGLEWSVGYAPTTTGWSGTVSTDHGMPNISTTLEGGGDFLQKATYGLNGLFALCMYADYYYTKRRLILN